MSSRSDGARRRGSGSGCNNHSKVIISALIFLVSTLSPFLVQIFGNVRNNAAPPVDARRGSRDGGGGLGLAGGESPPAPAATGGQVVSDRKTADNSAAVEKATRKYLRGQQQRQRNRKASNKARRAEKHDNPSNELEASPGGSRQEGHFDSVIRASPLVENNTSGKSRPAEHTAAPEDQWQEHYDVAEKVAQVKYQYDMMRVEAVRAAEAAAAVAAAASK